MSRRIDTSKPLSEEDLAYLRARDRHRELDEYALAQMGGGVDESEAGAVESGTKAKAEAEELVTTDPPAEAEPEKPTRRRRKSS